MPANTRSAIQSILSERLGATVKVEDILPVGGGSINEAARINTNKGPFFAKWNDSNRFPKMMELEAKGLELLRKPGVIFIPEVIGQKTIEGIQYLVLEHIESSPTTPHFWHDFGRNLAKLHKHSAEKFGLDHDNYIGSLPQSNRQHATWGQFFILERLQPQLKMAVDAGRMNKSAHSQFERLFAKLPTLFPKEKPSLLHGDLWSGNYLPGPGGAYLIDPAVYYGHREMDLAMSRLFGGFSEGFYEGYADEFPLEKGWKDRTDICNLYPLMVHVNLFGGSYSLQVETTLRRF